MSAALHTERLLIRPQDARDADVIVAGLSNFEVAKYLTPVPHPYLREDVEGWIEKLPATPDPTHAVFSIDLPGTGMIGSISIASELGYWIAQTHWGAGYATEAAEAVLRWFFDTADADAVSSSVHEDNIASLALQRKLGFTQTGASMRFARARNCDVRHIETRLTRTAFEERSR